MKIAKDDLIKDIGRYNGWKKELEEIQKEKEALWVELTGLKGIDTTKEPSAYNKELVEQRRLELIDEWEDLCKLEDMHKLIIWYIEKCFENMGEDVSKLTKRIYQDKERYEDVAMDTYTSKGSLQYKINKAFKDFKF